MIAYSNSLPMIVALILMVILVDGSKTGSSIIKRHSDGSISSNVGQLSLTEKFFYSMYDNAKDRPFRSARVDGDFKTRLLASRPLSEREIEKIVDEHNKYRRMVTATGMQKLTWDPMLAIKAQRHADECTLDHTINRGNTGENIWVAQYDDFSLAVRLWYEEVFDKRCSCTNVFKECCGHYTQLIWAETNKVGCGFAKCKKVVNAPGHQYTFVCQYSPAGNLVYMDNGQYVGLPAYKEPSPLEAVCSECPKGSTCEKGLCASMKK